MMMIEMLDPRGYTFEAWSKIMAERASVLGITSGGIEKQWKDWARKFVNQYAIASTGAPQPDRYGSWYAWALQMMNYTVTI